MYAANYPSWGANRPLVAGPVADARRVSKIAFWIFLLLTVVSVLNLTTIIHRSTRDDRGDVLPLNPIMFFVAALMIFGMTPPAPRNKSIFWGTVLVAIFCILGFAGSSQITGIDIYYTSQVPIKMAIGVIGFPWLALRAVDSTKVSNYVKAIYLFGSLGAALALVQASFPTIIPVLSTEQSRSSGLWLNPNNCGFMACSCFFLQLAFPLKRKTLNYCLSSIFIACVIVTLSRMAILCLIVGLIVYSIRMGKAATLLKIAATLFAILVVAFFVVNVFMDSTKDKDSQSRLVAFKELLRGEIGDQIAKGRGGLWKVALTKVLNDDWILGLGHGSMFRISDGVGPHNYYIFVLGNSGIFALVALLAWKASLIIGALGISDRRISSSMLALAIVFCMVSMADHAWTAHQINASAVAALVLVSHHYRKTTSLAARNPPQPIPATPLYFAR